MPTLARLSFWVLPEQMPNFLKAYEKRVTPILKKHGLAESSQEGRTTIDRVFSRLFELPSPAAVAQKRQDLEADPEWQAVLRHLEVAFGHHSPKGVTQLGFGEYALELYATPSGPGTAVAAGAGRGLWRTYDVTGGPSGFVFSVFRDREGYLWFGTGTEGVCRYDGSSFRFFTDRDGLAYNHVRAIHQDRDGCLWFGSGGGPLKGRGVSRYDGHTFTVFTTRDGLAHDTVLSILQDRDGVYWFGTGGGGVSRYDGTTFTTVTTENGLAGNEVRAIVQDRGGLLWFGTVDGVSRYDGSTWRTFATEDGLVSNRINAAIEDRHGCLWFGTANGGMSCYDGRSFTSYTTRDGLAGANVRSIHQDRDGYLWFGTFGGGVSRYDGQSFTTFSTRDGLAQLRVVSIGEDSEGHLWFGTHRGVCRYDGPAFTTFAVEDGLPDNAVNDMLHDPEGRMWVATDRGVSRYDGTTFTTFTSADGLASDSVTRVLADRAGNLWFATTSGVSRYDGATFATFAAADGLADSPIVMFEDRDGCLWFGTYGAGVVRYDGTTFTRFTTADGLPHNAVQSICQTREGHLWFGTYGGVGRYDGDTITSFDAEPDVTAVVGYVVFGDQAGTLWVATLQGLRRYDGTTWTTLTTEDGLLGKTSGAMWQDRQGKLWLAHGLGVVRYDGQTFQVLTRQDGLAGHAVSSILEDREGALWFGTNGGVTRFRPPAPSSPRVFIDAVVADRRYDGEQELTLPVSAGLITFEFHAMSFRTRPEAVVYRCRLGGYEEAWQTVRAPRVEYPDLPTGTYTFEVQAVDRDLNYSEPAAVVVNIQPDPHVEALTEALSGSGPGGDFVGTSPALRRLQAHLAEVAPTDLTVLVTGETGTGKGLAARTIHQLSGRKGGAFIPVNCGTIPDGLVESELFGHEKGAFTGAVSRQIGKVELARDGTLFLDEIGDLSPPAQVKLLQVLDEGTFARVGGTEQLRAQARVIAATNRDLSEMVAAGGFRSDLLYRLQVFPVHVPPLRERRQDIELLAFYFMGRTARHIDKEVADLTPEASALLQAHPWPGNVRELEHVIQRAVVVCPGSAIRPEDIALDWRPTEKAPVGERLTLEELERRYILEVLEDTGWVIKGKRGATEVLGLPESTLRHRMKKLGIRRP